MMTLDESLSQIEGLAHPFREFVADVVIPDAVKNAVKNKRAFIAPDPDTLYWTFIAKILDGYKNEHAKTLSADETQILDGYISDIENQLKNPSPQSFKDLDKRISIFERQLYCVSKNSKNLGYTPFHVFNLTLPGIKNTLNIFSKKCGDEIEVVKNSVTDTFLSERNCNTPKVYHYDMNYLMMFTEYIGEDLAQIFGRLEGMIESPDDFSTVNGQKIEILKGVVDTLIVDSYVKLADSEKAYEVLAGRMMKKSSKITIPQENYVDRFNKKVLESLEFVIGKHNVKAGVERDNSGNEKNSFPIYDGKDADFSGFIDNFSGIIKYVDEKKCLLKDLINGDQHIKNIMPKDGKYYGCDTEYLIFGLMHRDLFNMFRFAGFRNETYCNMHAISQDKAGIEKMKEMLAAGFVEDEMKIVKYTYNSLKTRLEQESLKVPDSNDTKAVAFHEAIVAKLKVFNVAYKDEDEFVKVFKYSQMFEHLVNFARKVKDVKFSETSGNLQSVRSDLAEAIFSYHRFKNAVKDLAADEDKKYMTKDEANRLINSVDGLFSKYDDKPIFFKKMSGYDEIVTFKNAREEIDDSLLIQYVKDFSSGYTKFTQLPNMIAAAERGEADYPEVPIFQREGRNRNNHSQPQLDEPQSGTVSSKKPKRNILKIAAGALVGIATILGVGIGANSYFSSNQPNTPEVVKTDKPGDSNQPTQKPEDSNQPILKKTTGIGFLNDIIEENGRISTALDRYSGRINMIPYTVRSKNDTPSGVTKKSVPTNAYYDMRNWFIDTYVKPNMKNGILPINAKFEVPDFRNLDAVAAIYFMAAGKKELMTKNFYFAQVEENVNRINFAKKYSISPKDVWVFNTSTLRLSQTDGPRAGMDYYLIPKNNGKKIMKKVIDNYKNN